MYAHKQREYNAYFSQNIVWYDTFIIRRFFFHNLSNLNSLELPQWQAFKHRVNQQVVVVEQTPTRCIHIAGQQAAANQLRQ